MNWKTKKVRSLNRAKRICEKNVIKYNKTFFIINERNYYYIIDEKEYLECWEKFCNDNDYYIKLIKKQSPYNGK